MTIKIKHVLDDDNTIVSVLEIMYAEAFKDNVLRFCVLMVIIVIVK